MQQFEAVAALDAQGAALSDPHSPGPDAGPDARAHRVRRALVIDRRAVMGTEICRILGRRGFAVDVAGERLSPAFHSRWCARKFISPGMRAKKTFLRFIEAVVETNHYEGIFVCNEEVLECLLDLPRGVPWRGLLLSTTDSLRTALSRKAVGKLAAEIGLDTPRTIVPPSDNELAALAAGLGFPLVVKGDRGEAGNHVRLVRSASGLLSAYREIAELERGSGERPVLQEFIRGPAYSVGGLFDGGRPLRVCAHRKIVGVPPLGGLTAKGRTESAPGLLEAAFQIFRALRYTGLGHAEFIRDADGRFRFLEVNPRVWGTFAISDYAGVDLFGAYLDLAKGRAVEPNLEFREGVVFHRILREARLLRRRPAALFRIIKDCLDPAVRSDFEWSDIFPHLAAISLRGASQWRLHNTLLKRRENVERELQG